MSNTLMKSNLDNAISVLAKLRQCAETMLSLVGQLQASIGVRDAKRQEELFGSDVYARFHAFTSDGHHAEPPSDGEWRELESLFRAAFPRLYQLVAIDHDLTRDQLRLCLLVGLSFRHHVIMRVMDVDSNRVSRLKSQANKRLFGDKLASTLAVRLKDYV